MRYGNCVSFKDLDRIKALKAVGFDYVETGLSGLYGASAEEVEAFARVTKENGIPCEAVNVFYPTDLSIVGEAVDLAKIREYVEAAWEKVKSVGIKVAVFGSGPSRKCPEGFPRERAVEQLITVAREIMCPAAEKYGFTIAIEPLYSVATNTMNNFSEAEYVAEQVNHERLKMLADIYHMAYENDTFANLKNHASLAHCHISDPITRKYPHKTDPPKHIEICRQFFADLRGMGYNARMSIEAELANMTPPDTFELPEGIDPIYRSFYFEAMSSLQFLKDLEC